MKPFYKNIELGMILFFICNLGFCQESTTNPYKHGIGVAVGYTTGYGISYRYCPSRFSGQITFSPYKTSSQQDYSIGVALLYSLFRNESFDLQLYQGNHYHYNKSTENAYDQYKIKEGWNNGFGFDLELLESKRFGFNLMIGYAFYQNFTEIKLTYETALYFYL